MLFRSAESSLNLKRLSIHLAETAVHNLTPPPLSLFSLRFPPSLKEQILESVFKFTFCCQFHPQHLLNWSQGN